MSPPVVKAGLTSFARAKLNYQVFKCDQGRGRERKDSYTRRGLQPAPNRAWSFNSINYLNRHGLQIRCCHFYVPKRTVAILPQELFSFSLLLLSLVTRIPSDDMLNEIAARLWFVDMRYYFFGDKQTLFLVFHTCWKTRIVGNILLVRMLINRIFIIERNNIFCNNWERREKREKKSSLYVLRNK